MLQDETFESGSEAAQALYSQGKDVRVSFQGKVQEARSYYLDYVDFTVKALLKHPSELRLLDIGCGCGWSSYFLAEHGFNVTGLDLNPEAFEPASEGNLSLVQGSALDLPFESGMFDVVGSYQCLEHLPDPRRALNEIIRVLRPGGTVVIVGPNLLSPVLSLKSLLSGLIGGTILWKRQPDTPKHSYGNTATENLASFGFTCLQLFRKSMSKDASFVLRIPDDKPPFFADNDACYYCNPLDLIRFFGSHGFTKIRNGKIGRPPASWIFAGGTWIAYEAPM